MDYRLRDYRPGDAAAVNAVALAAFEEYRSHYADWTAFTRIIGNMASLAASGELIVATVRDRVVGAVVHVGPGRKKHGFFAADWAVLRMLVVAPPCRGRGIGRALAEACLRRAERDGATVIALHTTPIMTVALPMYERMGFRYRAAAPDICGVPYRIYVRPLSGSGERPV